jgi:hypothetical protein
MGALEGAVVLGQSTSNVFMTRFDDIRLLRINYLRGPNIWTYRPVLEVWLDLGQLEDFPSNLLPGFNDRLTGLLAGAGSSTTAAWANAAASSSACAKAPGRATCWNTSSSSC